jgi:phosphoribosylamine---glycine ligase
VRFGDPEAQVVIPMIADDLAPHLAAAADGALDTRRIAFRPERFVGVVVASRGYPASSENGVPLHGLDAAAAENDVLVFHAGTAKRDHAVVTAGGRVLTVVGRGRDYSEAIARAYEGVSKVSFSGMHYRRDIGQKALALSSRS